MKKFLILLFALGLMVWSGCSKDDDEDELKAAFTWQLTDNPGEVAFTNISSNAQTFEWNFGDGFSSTAQNPSHVYDENDSYIVTLKAFGDGVTSIQDTVIVKNIP
ncbi:MAG: PKD domain-containing protein [Bacteroidota bacterium]